MAWEDYESKIKYYEQRLQELEEELTRIKTEKQQIDDVIQKAYLDPKKRQALKEIAAIAGVNIDDPVYEKVAMEEIDSVRKELDKIKAEQEQQKAKEYQERLRELMQAYDISESELEKVKEFVNETKLIPTSIEGWEIVFQNYKRAKVASPTLIGTNTNIFKETVSMEDYLKNPKAAFFKYAETILKQARR
ncbi:MAG: hypothetical protein RMI01_08785 [Thermodesulfovibrio sp.]|nr:hypothetical protein [Thermodesulfovibrio sp.]